MNSEAFASKKPEIIRIITKSCSPLLIIFLPFIFGGLLLILFILFIPERKFYLGKKSNRTNINPTLSNLQKKTCDTKFEICLDSSIDRKRGQNCEFTPCQIHPSSTPNQITKDKKR